MLPGNLLHPLKLDVVGFKEEDHDYHFRVELLSRLYGLPRVTDGDLQKLKDAAVEFWG